VWNVMQRGIFHVRLLPVIQSNRRYRLRWKLPP
jgi:hypothetical protein